MIYKVIGLMSGSSLDGLDIGFVNLHENAGKWSAEIKIADCYPYPSVWRKQLQSAPALNALDYQLLHTSFGHYLGEQVNKFITENNLQYQVQLIASHGHTVFHIPEKRMTAQLGEGSAIAAVTGINVVSDLRSMDVALGGQGAPIVPIGEKLLFHDYDFFLNIGGIANISFQTPEKFIAFDVCPANSMLNKLAQQTGKEYDDGGQMAAQGNMQQELFMKLNQLDYYHQAHPKSLANSFGWEVVYPLIQHSGCSVSDALFTYTAHIVLQVKTAVSQLLGNSSFKKEKYKLLSTGGGTFNRFLMGQLKSALHELNVETILPDDLTIKYKEALIMALIGVLRWREENNVLASVTGAKRNSIGGAIWMGQEA